MRILVTGASGFVGSRTCSLLEATGHDVIRITSSDRSGRPNEFALDIAEPEEFSVLDDIGDIDAIVHCAGIAHRFGRTPHEEFWRVNVDGARNVADFAARKQVSRFVHLSSVLVYGRSTSPEPINENRAPEPTDDYSCSKLAGEIAVAAACEAAGIDLVILRPAPITGEGSRGNVARLIDAIDRKRFIWIGDGRNERSFVDISDVAAAILTTLTLSGPISTFNVTGGVITVREMVEIILEQLGRSRPARLVPHSLAALSLTALKPLARVPMVDKYYRTLETWLSDAVYSGEALVKRGFSPATQLRDSLRNEVNAYLRSKQ